MKKSYRMFNGNKTLLYLQWKVVRDLNIYLSARLYVIPSFIHSPFDKAL